ncbi:MAG: type 4a pilus biogenesis protein PilO [Thermodesulfobacteriota bacterium]
MPDFRRYLLVFQSNKSLWLVVGACLVINLLYFAVVTGEQKSKVARLHQNYREMREKDLHSVNRDGAIRQFIQAREQIQAFRKTLPEESVSEQLSEEVNTLIQKNGLAVEPVVFKPEGIVDLLLLKYAADLTLQGPYPRLKQLLADIQNSPRLFCIETLSFENSPTQPGGVTLRVTISTYFRGSLQLQS